MPVVTQSPALVDLVEFHLPLVGPEADPEGFGLSGTVPAVFGQKRDIFYSLSQVTHFKPENRSKEMGFENNRRRFMDNLIVADTLLLGSEMVNNKLK